LEEVADRQVKQYSSGMRQKLGLAASMIGLPEILILDEPTSDLDPIGRSKIISYIKELSQDTSVFVSSHILSEIEQMCDTVTIINNGEIVLTDTVENVKKLHGEGSYRYIIDTTNNEKTLQYLKGEQCIEKITIDPTTDMIHAITTDSSALEQTVNQLIMNQDIFLRRFTPQEISLEAIFLDLIESEEKE
jgi:ABC-2 type transport system ATP-binding protein